MRTPDSWTTAAVGDRVAVGDWVAVGDRVVVAK